MNFGKIGATLVQATNLVILMNNSNEDIRKFVVWQKNSGDVSNSEKFTEVLQGMQISRIAIEDQAKLFEHPLETGAVIVDHEIFEPKRAVIQAYISNDDVTTLNELESLYLSGATLRIRAQNNVIDNIVLASKPYEINGAMFDKTLYSIAFKEAQEVSPAYVKFPPQKVVKKSNASRVNTGVKQAKKTNKSYFYSIRHGGRTK